MYNSGPVEQRGFLGLRGGILQFDSMLESSQFTNFLVKHQHTLRNKISRGNARIHHLKQLCNIMHMSPANAGIAEMSSQKL